MNLEIESQIKLSLAHALRAQKITEEEVLAYLIFFDAIADDEQFLKKSIQIISEKEGLFKELSNGLNLEDNHNIDLQKVEQIKKTMLLN